MKKRIHVTGNAGAGKTTLARMLAEHTGLPLYGLDRVVWQAGWKKTPLKERIAMEQELIEQPEWIIEGVSSRVRDAADLVIFLDRTRAACTLRCFKRSLPHLFRSRPELPERCPEILIVPKLLEIIWKFPGRVGAEILRESKKPENSGRIVVFKSDRDVARFLQGGICRKRPS